MACEIGREQKIALSLVPREELPKEGDRFVQD